MKKLTLVALALLATAGVARAENICSNEWLNAAAERLAVDTRQLNAANAEINTLQIEVNAAVAAGAIEKRAGLIARGKAIALSVGPASDDALSIADKIDAQPGNCGVPQHTIDEMRSSFRVMNAAISSMLALN